MGLSSKWKERKTTPGEQVGEAAARKLAPAAGDLDHLVFANVQSGGVLGMDLQPLFAQPAPSTQACAATSSRSCNVPAGGPW